MGDTTEPKNRELMRKALELVRPSTVSLAYALFLATNATVIWGGTFPFLPLEFQTRQMTVSFFTAQTLAFSLSFVACLALLLLRPPGIVPNRLATAVAPAAPYALGWALLIAAMYLPDLLQPLCVGAGALIGCSVAGFLIAWTRVICIMPRVEGARITTQGLLFAPLLYLALGAVPTAITAFLMPTIFMPLFTLRLVLETRDRDFSAAPFTRAPREDASPYKQAATDYWRMAFCIATFGFACGAMRSLAVTDPGMGAVVNAMSMIGALLSAVALMYVWNFRSMRFNAASFYRLLYPWVMAGFFLLPLVGAWLPGYVLGFAGVLYAVYTAAFALVLIQTGQASRARGINPVFLFCGMGGIIYLANDFGFLTGQFAETLSFPGTSELASLALVSLFGLALIYYVGQGGWRQALSPNRVQAEHIELILSPQAPQPRKRESAGDATGRPVESADPTSARCKAVAAHYGLSAREADVMELMVRGMTVKQISQELLVSENTVRTHSKRLYTKLDVHKKTELRDLVEGFRAG
ncbi:MAG: helix-turn-helix transcriptional regulator [Coriobacteriia bacterium]|nr:helix-turn-helix transcriptional regulator [Coriobacteriia bacterium]